MMEVTGHSKRAPQNGKAPEQYESQGIKAGKKSVEAGDLVGIISQSA